MSRIRLVKKKSQALQASEAAVLAMDRRLMESALKFGNGDDARTCFDWVSESIQERARAAGCSTRELASLKWAGWAVPARDLRWKLRVCLARSLEVQRSPLDAREQHQIDGWFTEQLAEVQTILKCRMVGGQVLEAPIPRLDSVERCVAYAIRLYLLDAHNFRRAVKQCPFVDDPLNDPLERALNWHADENIRRVPHWFLQWPITKQLFCTKRHAWAYRQRLKRASDARKRK
jgi:hypothetical protein